MASLKIKYAKGVVTLFAVCLIGTATAAPNGNGDDKEKKEVKVESEKALVNQTWYFTGNFSNDATDSRNYSSDPDDAQPCELPFETICQIEAPESPTTDGQPHMEAPVDGVTVQDQIIEALSSLSGPNPNPTLNSTVTGFKAE
ncbi:hypothetical protein [Sphingobacterium chuzhouense]|uniref:Secreted protein n=1 Tax=Sphingobacterium chuzhouense TaxID=1742264 RepID=A0ABR7XXI6_9SPHI|nr:hypothetical protein [Sphingobacterium chuzhouense]MBD1423751.1 hypothetical protein [Sphingobacterium chuzhouense]